MGKQNFIYRTIVTHDMVEECNRFLIHGPFKTVHKFRKPFRVDPAMLIKPVKSKPLAEKLRGKPLRFGILEHPLGLLNQLLRVTQFAPFSRTPQFFVGQRGPQKITQPASQFKIRQRCGLFFFCYVFCTIEKFRGDKHTRDQGLRRHTMFQFQVRT